MQYLFLLLLLTACGQKIENKETPLPIEKDNITNIALAKYEARESLSKEEYLVLRKPVPDWETYKRLVRAEDGFDDLRRFYLATNTVAPNLEWCGVIYYDATTESYYQGVFTPTNIESLSTLVQSKKDPAHEVYGRDRVVLISNISPSFHIYADAYNKYKLYTLNLKSTIDEYGVVLGRNIYYPVFYFKNPSKRAHITWRTETNHKNFYYLRVIYIALTNGAPLVSPTHSPYGICPITLWHGSSGTYSEKEKESQLMIELTNTNKEPINGFAYMEETKKIYYGIKYNFYGDIAELTNTAPPMQTNYTDWFMTTAPIIQQYKEEQVLGDLTRHINGALNITP